MNILHAIRRSTVASLVLTILLCMCVPLEGKRSRDNNNRKKKPGNTMIIKAVAPTDTQSFAYYRQKTYEFLGHLNAKNSDNVAVEVMPKNDQHYHSSAGYANGSVIRLNMESFKRQSHAQNLFTCAHEAAHYACGHTFIHPHTPKRSSFVVEQEADETAARMLCNHGYAWVIEECVKQLHLHMQYGDAYGSDGIHPTYAQQHDYLKTIVAHAGGLRPHAEQQTMDCPEAEQNRYSKQELYIYAGICASIVAVYLKNRWYPHATWIGV